MDEKKPIFNIQEDIDPSMLKTVAAVNYVPRRLLKSSEVLEFFQIHRNTLSNWKRAGMPVVRLNNTRGGQGYRFDAEQILRWLQLKTRNAQ